MMKRRGFLAFIGLAPVAGPAVLEDAVTGRNMLGLGAKAARYLGDSNYADVEDSNESVKEDAGPYNPENYLRSQIRDALDAYREQQLLPLIEYIRSVDQLDGDLQMSRSLSLTTKIRIQAERNRNSNLEKQHSGMSKTIAHLRKRLFEKDSGK